MLLPALAAALALAGFAPSLRSDFVWDDHQTVIGPADRGMFEISQLPVLFSRGYFLAYGEFSYRPVVTMTYFADFALWGLSAFGFRLSNLLLHAAAAALACALFLRVTSHAWVSLAAAFLFAVHPVQSEAVLNVSFREDILCVVFILAAFLCHARGVQAAGSGWNWRIAAALAYGAALFSKETALLVVPAVAFFREWTASGRRVAAVGAHNVLLFAVGALYALVRFGWMRLDVVMPVDMAGASAGSPVARLVRVPSLVLSYVRLIAWPVGLHAERTLGAGRGGIEAWVLLGVLLVGVFALVRRSKSQRAGITGILWVVLALAPVLGLVALPNPIAERYLYFAAPGVFLCVAVWVGEAVESPLLNLATRRAIVVAIVLVLAVYAWRSAAQSLRCRDDRTLWQNTLMEDSRNAKARNNLGVYYYRQGEKTKAMAIYRRNVNVNPWNVVARRHLGSLYLEAGLYDKALQQFEAALRSAPSSPMLHYEAGRALLAIENLAGARSAFEAALRHNPHSVSARTHLALVLHYLGKESLAQREAVIAASLAHSPQEKAEVQELIQRLTKPSLRP